jgi:hypothetical protein
MPQRTPPKLGDFLTGSDCPGVFVKPAVELQSEAPHEEIRRRLEAARVKIEQLAAQVRADKAKAKS